jgi:hypothetical protein
VHSGLLYPDSRDPTAFFSALKRLVADGRLPPGSVKIILRASGHDDYYRRLIVENGVQDIVSPEPAVSYHEALTEMLNADGLLIFQASDCNHLIPAKLYEYMRARKPILALTDPNGDTADLMRASGLDTIVPLDRETEIADGLFQFISRVRDGSAPKASDRAIASHSRQALTGRLVELFESLSPSG